MYQFELHEGRRTAADFLLQFLTFTKERGAHEATCDWRKVGRYDTAE